MPPLLKVENLRLHHQNHLEIPSQTVDGISFELSKGEALGIIGESGAGKSSLARAITGILPGPLFHTSGEIRLEGVSPLEMDSLTLRKSILGSKVALIPQDPLQALPASRRVKQFAVDVLQSHFPHMSTRETLDRIQERFRQIGLDPAKCLDPYPTELSPALTVQTVIAIATLMNPSLLIVDDLRVDENACTELLLRIKKQEIVTSLLIFAKEASVLVRSCHRIATMCAGEWMEQGPVDQVLGNPRHPYTRCLLQATLPSPIIPPIKASGCRFADRCPHVQPDCISIRQALRTVQDRDVRCMYAQ